MPSIHDTQISPMRVRERRVPPMTSEKPSEVKWQNPSMPRRAEAFTKNLGVAAALILCAVTLRTGAIPEFSPATDAILTAATDQSLLDDQLGKLSFVSALFPEAVLVFGEQHDDSLSIPTGGKAVVHTWSEAEPYLSVKTDDEQVNSYASGEVIGVYHGNGSERLVQVLGNDGLSCMYGNLAQVNVQVGDSIVEGQTLGTLMPGAELVLQVYKSGISVDPVRYFE